MKRENKIESIVSNLDMNGKCYQHSRNIRRSSIHSTKQHERLRVPNTKDISR